MKALLRDTVINALALYIVPQILPGVQISEGIFTYLLAGLVLTLMFKVLKPLFNIISLPLNVVTLGLFSFFSNAIILYLLTVIVPQIKISSFIFPGYSKFGFVIPQMGFNTLMAYVVSAAAISIIVSVINWLIKK